MYSSSSIKNLVFFFALAFIPAIVSSRRLSASHLEVTGHVYCDTCLLGYETEASTPIAGATVKLECKSRETDVVVRSYHAVTDDQGKYLFTVNGDHSNEICSTVLVSSPQLKCKTADPGRNRATVILNSDNGMASNQRYANSMGFFQDKASKKCSQIVQRLQELDV